MAINSDKLKEVAEKVKKLLALSTSSNAEEAALAAQKAKDIFLNNINYSS